MGTPFFRHWYFRPMPEALTDSVAVVPVHAYVLTGCLRMAIGPALGTVNVADQERANPVLAFLNIAASGMHTGHENDPAEMDAENAARIAKENPDLIVGFKSAH